MILSHIIPKRCKNSTTKLFSQCLFADSSKSDNIQRIVDARRHNFMIQGEQKAAAAKERALAQFQSQKEGHPVFRAVPVNVVAEPTLSMAVNTNSAERGKSPTSFLATSSKGVKSVMDTKRTFEAKEVKEPPSSGIVPVKGGKSVSDAKKSFEAKEKEIKATIPSKHLNKALQPRGLESPKTTKDSGTKPSEATSRNRDSGSKFTGSKLSLMTPDDKKQHGRLFGEIQQFGGSVGLAQRQPPSPSSPKKTPPQVMPKPARLKPEPTSQPAKPASALSKTLSSWKKSRAVTAPSTSSRGLLTLIFFYLVTKCF